jgi:hypothetical protein
VCRDKKKDEVKERRVAKGCRQSGKRAEAQWAGRPGEATNNPMAPRPALPMARPPPPPVAAPLEGFIDDDFPDLDDFGALDALISQAKVGTAMRFFFFFFFPLRRRSK